MISSHVTLSGILGLMLGFLYHHFFTYSIASFYYAYKDSKIFIRSFINFILRYFVLLIFLLVPILFAKVHMITFGFFFVTAFFASIIKKTGALL